MCWVTSISLIIKMIVIIIIIINIVAVDVISARSHFGAGARGCICVIAEVVRIQPGSRQWEVGSRRGHLAFRRGTAGRLTQLRQRVGAKTTLTLRTRRARALRLGALLNCCRIPREFDGDACSPAVALPGS